MINMQAQDIKPAIEQQAVDGVHMPYKCTLCPKSYGTTDDLKNHFDVSHLHKCFTCGSFFVSLFTLKIHQVMHTVKKQFECEICHKKFKTKTGLNNHMSVHSDKKPFQCPWCLKTYTRKAYFHIHMNRFHKSMISL